VHQKSGTYQYTINDTTKSIIMQEQNARFHNFFSLYKIMGFGGHDFGLSDRGMYEKSLETAEFTGNLLFLID
jgi:hypothetical protein